MNVNDYKKHIKENFVHVNTMENVMTHEYPMTFDFETCECEGNDQTLPHIEREERVYLWAIGNVKTSVVVYGETLDEFFNYIQSMGSTGTTRKKNVYTIYAHNLAWDLEFIKYWLRDNGYTYHIDSVKDGQLKKEKFVKKSFNIAENDGIVYGAKIIMANGVTLELIDSYKIMSQSLESISKRVVKIDKLFQKDGSKYDYEGIRPYGHKPTQLEKEYMYSDIYILNEFLNQFYLPINAQMKTASGIAFETFIEMKYGNGKYKDNVESFEEHFPPVENSIVRQLIQNSYKGGWTQANQKFKGYEQTMTTYGVSIDINSSYPAVVKKKPLPYGVPVMYDGATPNVGEGYMKLLTIGFDGFRNKDEDNLIGWIQVMHENKELFNRKGTEYVATNIDNNGECFGQWGKDKHYHVTMTIWEFELLDILQNADVLTYQKKEFCDRVGLRRFSDLQLGYDVLNTIIFQCETGYFGEAVDHCMEMKNKGKREGNAPMTEQGKLLANSFYGKMASSTERVIRTLDFSNDIISYVGTDMEYETNLKYYPAFASCVTAWARTNLRQRLYEVGFENVLYFDTDSLYTNLDEPTLLSKGVPIDEYELGDWKVEKHYRKFKAIGSKKYILQETKDGGNMCKCAGLPKEVRDEITFETFYIGKEFDNKKAKLKVKGGYRLVKTTFKISDSLF